MFYENYLNSIKPDTSYIPESVSLSDKAIFLDRALQDVYNEAFFTLASQEMAVFESVIREADEEDGGAVTAQYNDASASPEKKKGLLEIIKKAISTIWSKVKGFFVDLIENIKKKFADFKKDHNDKLKKDFEKGVDKLPANYQAKGIYKFEYINKQDIKDKASAVADLANKAYNDALMDAWAEKYNKDTIAKALGFDSADNFKIEAPEKVTVNKSDINGAKVLIIKTVFDPDGFLKQIKEAYNSAKKSIDGAMKAAKSCINKKDKSYADLNKACKEIISFCRDCSSMITKFVSKKLNVLKSVRSNYTALFIKIAMKGSGKDKKEESKDEKVSEDTQVTIDVKDDEKEPEVEVKDEVEEAFAFLEGDDEEVEVDVESDDDSEEVDVMDDDEIEESALYQALSAYLD